MPKGLQILKVILKLVIIWLLFTREPRQKRSFMALVHQRTEAEKCVFASVYNRGQKLILFGLSLICLGYETGVQ